MQLNVTGVPVAEHGDTAQSHHGTFITPIVYSTLQSSINWVDCIPLQCTIPRSCGERGAHILCCCAAIVTPQLAIALEYASSIVATLPRLIWVIPAACICRRCRQWRGLPVRCEDLGVLCLVRYLWAPRAPLLVCPRGVDAPLGTERTFSIRVTKPAAE